MKTYVVEFTWRGNRYADTIQATSTFAARKLIRVRYPDAVIWNVREK
jgi:hypothetical protein